MVIGDETSTIAYYFVTGRVHSHRDGDVNAKSCRIPNLAQVRVVVT